MNLNNGLTFGIEGPNMTGTWYNPKTGDTFVVRNTFFQDNNYIIQTEDGRVLDYNQVQNYIQQADGNFTPPPRTSTSNQSNNLPSEVLDLLDNETSGTTNINDFMLNDDLQIINNTSQSKPVGNIFNKSQEVGNNYIIEKALGKLPKPNINIDIKYEKFPHREISTLIDIMDIDINEIAEWYINNINIDDIYNSVNEGVRKLICNESPEPTKKESVEPLDSKPPKPTKSSKPDKPTKPTTKKTTKKQ
jgi:hypothetical protein